MYVTVNASNLPDDFTFMTSFPRRVYNSEDMEKPLSALGRWSLLSQQLMVLLFIIGYLSFLLQQKMVKIVQHVDTNR